MIVNYGANDTLKIISGSIEGGYVEDDDYIIEVRNALGAGTIRLLGVDESPFHDELEELFCAPVEDKTLDDIGGRWEKDYFSIKNRASTLTLQASNAKLHQNNL